MPIRMPMMAITTSNSTSVNALEWGNRLVEEVRRPAAGSRARHPTAATKTNASGTAVLGSGTLAAVAGPARLAAAAVYVQALVGALVRHADGGAALGLGPQASIIGVDPATGARTLWPADGLGQLQALHRGFAVVADEVRKLADRTTKATDEIAESIKAIQAETGEAVQRMNAGTQQVSTGVESATEAGKSLQKIVTSAPNRWRTAATACSTPPATSMRWRGS